MSLKLQVRNLTRGTLLGDAIVKATSSAERRTGLLKHTGLARGEGLWIVPCEAVHTLFMKFAIDVLYLSREGKVRKAVRNLAPWRFSGCLTARSVLELPVGAIERTKTQEGDLLEFVPQGEPRTK